MHLPRSAKGIVSALCLYLRVAASQLYTGPQDPRLVTQLSLQDITNGVSTTPDGRLFLVISRIDGYQGPQVVEVDRLTGTQTAYPDEVWTSYQQGDDPAQHFVSINSQRIGPDGNLYVVDTGAPGFGNPALVPFGPKLVQINITTNSVSRVYYFENTTVATSFLDDVRFDLANGKAYLSDAGSPSGLIVLDLDSGTSVHVLNNQISTRQYIPISAEGTILKLNGKPAFFFADQLEVSPDGKYLAYQPASGGMSRIPTSILNAAFYNATLAADNDILGSYVEPYAHTPSTGGTAIDAEGNIYNSDTDSQRIIKIFPNGTMTLLVQDPRLLWVDAMWVDAQGLLWMPAAQLNRGQPFNNGTSHISKPMEVYIIDIGIGPSPIDHA